MALFFINNHNIHRFLLKLLSSRTLYALKSVDERYYWKRFTTETVEFIESGKFRAITPPKQFFFPIQEVLVENKTRPVALFGVKACDIHLMRTTDSIFLGGVAPDNFYNQNRTETLIMSADCSDCLSSCFCTKMELEPFPVKDFDINFSKIREGYVVECGSNLGENLVLQSPNLFQKAIDQQVGERNKNRKALSEKVSKNNNEYTWNNPFHLVENSMNSKLWKEDIAKTCVECDGCRWVCGSCYCFLLGETKDIYAKIRTWDSCQSAGYARVAGGANPKKEKSRRLENYYACKLVYRVKNFGKYACSGCGRCIEVCPGKIDIRESLKKMQFALSANKI